jgi:hypothetical protein
MADARVLQQVQGRFWDTAPFHVRGGSNRDESSRAAESDRHHILRHTFREPNARIEPFRHDIHQASLRGEIEVDLGKASKELWDCKLEQYADPDGV